MSIGDASELTTRAARAIAKEYLAQISKGQHPRARQDGSAEQVETDRNGAVATVTLKQAWQRYLEAHLIRKGRSEKTISGYRDHVERLFAEWLDTPLLDLAKDPGRVAEKHDQLTKENGRYMANGSMRTLRAIYNHARKINRSLPRDNPADAVDWNQEERRNTGMGTGDLKGWFIELARLDNPIRREFHLFTLLCGSRPAALQQAKPEHIDFRRRTLHIPKPKGGSKRAFDIPLSREMILSLIRVLRFGRQMHPSRAREWLFPAESASGHLAETKEDREILSKWGNDLRQTFRTIATAAGVSEFDAKLLMNHSIPGVNAGYVTRHKLVEDHLRSQQQAISTVVFSALGKLLAEEPLTDWLGQEANQRAVGQFQLKPTNRDERQERIRQVA